MKIVTYDSVVDEVDWQLKEDGTYYEFLHHCITNSEYEDIFEEVVINKIEEYNKKGILIIENNY